MKFYAILCPKCRTWRACMIQNILSYRFRCFQCGITRKLHDAKYGGLVLHTKGPYSSEVELGLAVGDANGGRR